MRERWGCPAAGHKPPAELPPDLADEDAHAARLMGTLPAGTCPLACLERPDPWVGEVLNAATLASEWHVPVAQSLGREPTAADLDALTAVTSARGAAARSDDRIREQERANKASPTATRL